MYYPVQPYHLVTISPWPIYISFDLLIVCVNVVYYVNNIYSIYSTVNIIVLFSIINLIYSIYLWMYDIIKEGTYLGDHTSYIQNGIIVGFFLFIITEVFFFIGCFWAYLHSALVPAIQIGSIWPPIGIESVNPYMLPLLNTILLLSSGISVTYAHHYLIGRNRNYSIIGFIITIIFSIIFIYCQYIEYSNSTFSINDSVYGTVFYFITGLHGTHVIIGTIMLIISVYRVYTYQVTNNVHVGIETSIIYWHFVDLVWVIVFILVYWWAYLN